MVYNGSSFLSHEREMSVQELGALHQRYIDLSDRFKAAWTFHQFLQGMQKAFLEGTIGHYTADFQGVYGALKEASHNLNASETPRIKQLLDAVDRHLATLNATLEQEDSKVSPGQLRQFFQRVRNFDEKILAQLAKFYIYGRSSDLLADDKIDKIDFLLTKLAEGGGGAAPAERAALRDLHRSLWLAISPNGDGQRAEESRSAIEAMRGEVQQASSFEELGSLETIRRYRDLKHRLGRMFFEPETQLAILETNLALKAKVRQLYAEEERRIFSESQRIFELENRAIPDAILDQDLAVFHQEMARFEDQLRQDNVRLDQIAALREQVKTLLPRLEPAGAPRGGEVAEPEAAPARLDVEVSNPEFIGETFQRLVSTLEGSSPDDDPKVVTFTPEVFSLRLEPREVTAYRRTFGLQAASDRELEQFLLEAAASRIRINAEAELIMGLLDDTATRRDAPVFIQARETCRLADVYVRRFSGFIDSAVQSGNYAEAQALQVLRMRLIRDYSGLWLLANK
jgi:hypothetical protein